MRARQSGASRIAVRIICGTGIVRGWRVREFVNRGGGLILGMAGAGQERESGVVDGAVGDQILRRDGWGEKKLRQLAFYPRRN